MKHLSAIILSLLLCLSVQSWAQSGSIFSSADPVVPQFQSTSTLLPEVQTTLPMAAASGVSTTQGGPRRVTGQGEGGPSTPTEPNAQPVGDLPWFLTILALGLYALRRGRQIKQDI